MQRRDARLALWILCFLNSRSILFRAVLKCDFSAGHEQLSASTKHRSWDEDRGYKTRLRRSRRTRQLQRSSRERHSKCPRGHAAYIKISFGDGAWNRSAELDIDSSRNPKRRAGSAAALRTRYCHAPAAIASQFASPKPTYPLVIKRFHTYHGLCISIESVATPRPSFGRWTSIVVVTLARCCPPDSAGVVSVALDSR